MAVNSRRSNWGHRDVRERRFAAFVNIGAGDAEIITAPGAGSRIVVMSIRMCTVGASTTYDFKSGVTTLMGVGDEVLAWESGEGLLSCDDNEAFNVTVAGPSTISGIVSYCIEEAS